MPSSHHITPALSTGIKALFNDNILKKVLPSSNNLPVSEITSSYSCQCSISKAQIQRVTREPLSPSLGPKVNRRSCGVKRGAAVS